MERAGLRRTHSTFPLAARIPRYFLHDDTQNGETGQGEGEGGQDDHDDLFGEVHLDRTPPAVERQDGDDDKPEQVDRRTEVATLILYSLAYRTK